MSDLRHISTALSKYGRNGDDRLVHMSGSELRALHALSPRGLSTNPSTGLPEAFNLSDILGPIAGIASAVFAPELLPYVAGATGLATGIATGNIGQGILAGLGAYGAGSAAGALGAGSLFGGAADAAGAAAGLTGATAPIGAVTSGALADIPGVSSATAGLGGSISTGSDAAAGLIGGNGSIAAADPAAAIAAQGQAAADPYSSFARQVGTTPFNTASLSVPSLPAGAQPSTLSSIGNWAKNNPLGVAGGVMALGALSPNGSGNVPPAPNQIQPQPLVQGPVANPAVYPAGYVPGYGAEQSFFPNMPVNTNSPAQLAAGSAQAMSQAQQLNAAQAAQQTLAQAAYGGGGIGSPNQQAMQLLQAQQMAALNPNAQLAMQPQHYAHGGKLQPNTTRPNIDMAGTSYAMRNYDTGTSMPNFGGYMGGIRTPRHMADGGNTAPQMDPAVTQNLIAEAKAAILGQSDHPQEALQRFSSIFGQDALQQLAQAVTGAQGQVQGAGDGVADLVPGSIDGADQVRLANDEHVLPADVVSGLGNGSSEQGHRLLKEMTARVRGAKTGASQMPGRINPQDYMPG